MAEQKIINSKAEIKTGITAVELKGNLVKDLSPMNEKESLTAIALIKDYIIKSHSKILMLLSHEERYITIFKIDSDLDTSAKSIFDFLSTEHFFHELGGLKLIDESGDHLEVWIGKQFFALFKADQLIVEC